MLRKELSFKTIISLNDRHPGDKCEFSPLAKTWHPKRSQRSAAFREKNRPGCEKNRGGVAEHHVWNDVGKQQQRINLLRKSQPACPAEKERESDISKAPAAGLIRHSPVWQNVFVESQQHKIREGECCLTFCHTSELFHR